MAQVPEPHNSNPYSVGVCATLGLLAARVFAQRTIKPHFSNQLNAKRILKLTPQTFTLFCARPQNVSPRLGSRILTAFCVYLNTSKIPRIRLSLAHTWAIFRVTARSGRPFSLLPSKPVSMHRQATSRCLHAPLVHPPKAYGCAFGPELLPVYNC